MKTMIDEKQDIANAKRAASKEVQELREHYITLARIFDKSATPYYMGDPLRWRDVVAAKKAYEDAVATREALNNTVMVHRECADQRKKEWQQKNKNLVISAGDYAKIQFGNGDAIEHMWVEIKKVLNDGHQF